MIREVEDNTMANKEYRIQFNPNTLKVRDLGVKQMITDCGGSGHRVHTDKKKALKADVVNRKVKHKGRGWD